MTSLLEFPEVNRVRELLGDVTCILSPSTLARAHNQIVVNDDEGVGLPRRACRPRLARMGGRACPGGQRRLPFRMTSTWIVR